MKFLAISGSPHKEGNTVWFMNEIAKGLESANHEVEWIYLYDKNISGCRACYKCKETTEISCILKDDMQGIYQKIVACDGLILGSPIYFGYETGVFKTFIDRLYAFVGGDRKPKISGLSFALVIVSGAGGDYYVSVADYISNLLKGFFQFSEKGILVCGGQKRTLSAPEFPDYIKAAKEIAIKMSTDFDNE